MTLAESIKQYKVQFALMFLLLTALYSSIVPSMVIQWYKDANYSHGFLVPVIAGYFLYNRLDDLNKTKIMPSNWGFALIVFSLCQLIIGWLGMEYFTMRSSLVLLIAGIVICFFGMDAFRVARLPIAYLLFMVPIPSIIYDSIAFPLKLFVTKVSVGALKAIGVVVMREGNIIMFPATTLEVADACSGIRSLISLLAMAVAYACFMNTSNTRRWLIIALAVPIAIFTNALRVFVTGILAQYWGEKAAEGFFHEFAGFAVFGLAMVMLIGIGALLRKTGDREPGTRD
jgi:exosortase